VSMKTSLVRLVLSCTLSPETARLHVPPRPPLSEVEAEAEGRRRRRGAVRTRITSPGREADADAALTGTKATRRYPS
jgi:hypothetical protein